MKYYDNIRTEILPYLTKGSKSILELGCGHGYTLSYLKQEGYASRVIGVELNEDSKRKKPDNVDDILIGNLEDEDFSFTPKSFDCIIMNDVLEHLKMPERILRKYSDFLADDGTLIISLPTIRNWRVLSNLLIKADFSYEDAGIMDRTHLRFFTFKSMLRLFEDCGCEVLAYQVNYDGHSVAKLLKKIPFLKEFAAVQYVFKVKKSIKQ